MAGHARLAEHHCVSIDYERAKDLRRASTPAEQKFWRNIRLATRNSGYRFRRQQPIHPYIVDFACLQAMLIIEIDGLSHDLRTEYDDERNLYMASLGYRVVRFRNEDIEKNIEDVIASVMDILP